MIRRRKHRPPVPPPLPVPPPVPTPPPSALYCEPTGHARDQAIAWRASRPADAALMDQLAEIPIALWLGSWTHDITAAVKAACAKGLRVLVLYNIPKLNGGPGGSADATAYAAWVGAICAAGNLRGQIVVLEPDALAMQGIAVAPLLLAAVHQLVAAGATVYIDAGDANWIPASAMAPMLAAAGVLECDGFAVNVSHFETLVDSVVFGESLCALLGGDPHFVIDTGRNAHGHGPPGEFDWCNQVGAGLGVSPTQHTGVAACDWYLVVKPPGESDDVHLGPDKATGAPPPGGWMPEYALACVRLAVPPFPRAA